MADIDVINVGGVDYNIKDTTARNQIASSIVPVDHSSTDGKYGIGTSTRVGHVRPVDAFGSLVGSADQGIVASQKAVYDAYINCAHTQKQTENANFVTQPSITSLEGSSVANHPFNNGTYCTLYTWGDYGNYATQLAVPWTQSYHQIAFRSLVNGTWGAWKYINDQDQTAGNATLNTTYVNSSSPGVAYVKKGGMCYCRVQVQTNASVSGTYTQYKIASGLPAPSFPQYFIGNVSSDSKDQGPHFEIKADGTLDLMARYTSLANQTIVGAFIYII